MEWEMGYRCVLQGRGPGPSQSGYDQAWGPRCVQQRGRPEPSPLGLSQKWETFSIRRDPALMLVEHWNPWVMSLDREPAQ